MWLSVSLGAVVLPSVQPTAKLGNVMPNMASVPSKAAESFNALLLFTDIGYKIAIAFTKIMMMIAILVGCYGAATYITSSPVPGWTTTICFISFAFFALFGILTIIIKYLQIILNLIFRRKQVSFAGIEKMTK